MEHKSMTLAKKMHGSGLAKVAGVVLLGLSSVLGVTAALADSPPAPPARFAGTVVVNGTPATPGTSVEVHIGTTTCGVTTVFSQGGNSNYTVDSPALDPGATPNCGTDGAAVTFWVGGQKADQTGTWHSYQLNLVNLTVTTATATPAPSASATATRPATTPVAPTTGSGSRSSSTGTAVWLFAILGLGAVAFGVGGLTVARKRN
jgi:hypothetical protein